MVCDRCIKVVSGILNKQGCTVSSIELGKVNVESDFEINHENIALSLTKEGFELINDEQSKLISQIKALIIQQVHHQTSEVPPLNISAMLEKHLCKGYSYLSSLFSKVEGRTIEKYVILQRIERVKELLIYGDKNISEIAYDLGYSSSQYLSNQFKAETGLTPSEFRTLMDKPRKALDKL